MPIRNNTEGTKNIENTREIPKLDILIHVKKLRLTTLDSQRKGRQTVWEDWLAGYCRAGCSTNHNKLPGNLGGNRQY